MRLPRTMRHPLIIGNLVSDSLLLLVITSVSRDHVAGPLPFGYVSPLGY